MNENGAYAKLLEYENMEGYLLSTEVTKKRVKLVNKYMKVGKQEPMMVIRVDRDKRYIDLSKKKVLAADAVSTEMNFKKSKMVHNILKQMAVKLNQIKNEEKKNNQDSALKIDQDCDMDNDQEITLL